MNQPIPRQPVKSSQIASIGYEPASKTLAVEFKSGGVYHYANVGAEDHKALMDAPSIGSHFYKNIKPQVQKFPFLKQPSPATQTV